MGSPSETTKPRLLFVNPWIHDFAAYDLWVRPLGLLYLAKQASAYGFELDIVDVLDRHNPKWGIASQSKQNGTGHFFKEEIEKPICLKHIPRRFSRYGAPLNKVTEHLKSLNPPEIILLTSLMTYWYTGVKEMADLLREIFPNAQLILGGVYATLMPDHAMQTIKPNTLVTGNGESFLKKLLGEYTSKILSPENFALSLQNIWKHYPVLKSFPLLTSLGCPFNCTFCATKQFESEFQQTDPAFVIQNIHFAVNELKQTNFVFYDDALFYRAEQHIKPILRRASNIRSNLTFHTPNGLMPRFIDQELAELMAKARFVRPRLSLETTNPNRLADISSKVTRDHYINAVKNLHNAGYTPSEIITYLIVGLFGQSIDEIRDAVNFVYDTGAIVSLAFFSPIPGTIEYKRANLPTVIDPLLLNNTVFTQTFSPDLMQQLDSLRLYVKEKNARKGM